MTNKVLVPDDLSVLMRRGALSEAQQRRLQVTLRASPLSRVMHELGEYYDAMETRRPGDDQLLSRAVAGACDRRARAPKRPGLRRGMIFGFVAGLSCVSLAVAAAGITRLIERKSPAIASGPSHPTDETRGAMGSRAVPRARDLRRTPTGAEQGSTPKTDGSEARAGAVPDAVPATGSSPGPKPAAKRRASQGAGAATPLSPSQSAPPAAAHEQPLSAAEMFSEANRLRKSGRLGDAERAYRRLQQTHPQSDQASVSRVLLGRLLLGRGQLQAAHREFSRYLAAHARGSLAEEALQGSAMALRALGRQNDERAVWQTLLNRFPGSIYASRARERLRELSVQLGSRLAPEPQ